MLVSQTDRPLNGFGFLVVLLELLIVALPFFVCLNLDMLFGIYVSSVALLLLGLAFSFAVHKNRYLILPGAIIELVLIVLCCLPIFIDSYEPHTSASYQAMMRWGTLSIAMLCLILRIVLIVVLFWSNPTLFQVYSLYARIVSNPGESTMKSDLTERSQYAENDQLLKATDASEPQVHPFKAQLASNSPSKRLLFVQRAFLVLTILIGIGFIVAFVAGFFVGTVGGIGLSDEKNQVILRSAHNILGYILRLGFANLVFGIALITYAAAKPTTSRAVLILVVTPMFGLCNLLGDVYIHYQLNNPEFKIAISNKIDPSSYNAEYCYIMTAAVFGMVLIEIGLLVFQLINPFGDFRNSPRGASQHVYNLL